MRLDAMERRIYKDYRGYTKGKSKANQRYGDDFRKVVREYETIYKDYIYNLLINLITYENAPTSLNKRFLEWCLRNYGFAKVGWIDAENIFVVGQEDDTELNDYGLNALGFITSSIKVGNPFDETGQLQRVTNLDAKAGLKNGYVVVSNKFNYFAPTMQVFNDFKLADRVAKTLALIKATQLRNIELMRQQYIISSTNNNLTGQNIFHAIDNGEIAVTVDNSLGGLENAVTVSNFSVQDYLASLKDQFNNELDELLTMLGINTVGIDKKERLVAAEADGNAQLTEASANVYLDARQEQMDLINTCLGTNIQVTFNQDSYQALVELNQQIGYNQANEDDKHDGDED